MKNLEEQVLDLDVPLEEKVVYLCLLNIKTKIRIIDAHVADYNQESRMATQEEMEVFNSVNRKAA